MEDGIGAEVYKAVQLLQEASFPINHMPKMGEKALARNVLFRPIVTTSLVRPGVTYAAVTSPRPR